METVAMAQGDVLGCLLYCCCFLDSWPFCTAFVASVGCVITM